jgi:hypothetical protein
MPLAALAGGFPTTAERFFLAYSESNSAIDYLVSTYGRDAMVKLVRSYHDGVTDDEAFMNALGVDLARFEAGWLKSVGASAPVPIGPQPAPAGPLPPGWGEPGASGLPPASGAAGAPLGPAGGAASPAALIVVGAAAALLALLAIVLIRRRSHAATVAAPVASAPAGEVPEDEQERVE